MSTGISSSDFVGQWRLSFADIDFINSKPAATRLGLASQLKFFSARGFFADDGTLVPHDAAEYLAEQIGVPADELSHYDRQSLSDHEFSTCSLSWPKSQLRADWACHHGKKKRVNERLTLSCA